MNKNYNEGAVSSPVELFPPRADEAPLVPVSVLAAAAELDLHLEDDLDLAGSADAKCHNKRRKP